MPVPLLPINFGVQPEAQAWTGRPITVRVYNDGKLTVRVHAESVILRNLAGNTRCQARLFPGVKMTPVTFIVKPHYGVNVTVTAVPAGTADFGVLMVGTAVGGSKGHPVTLEAAVGSQITTHGHLTCGGHKAPVAAPAGLPVLPVALATAAFLAIVAVLLLTLRRRRRHS